MKPTGSSVTADKISIYEHTKACLKWIVDERERLKDIATKELIAEGKYTLWGLIKREPYTYKEARTKLELCGWEENYFWIDMKYSDDEKVFISIIDAIEISCPDSTTITLSTKDAHALQVYRLDM